ncbi:MAG: serine/threonine protein kinase [Myxococcales bacterium]|nr:serine/threonine protein kinase [Myxococcales bacterium]
MVTTAVPDELLRDRIRLYLQVMLAVDLAAYASDVVTPWLTGGTPVGLPAPFLYFRWGVTVVLAAGWAFTRFAAPGRRVLVALESAVTVGLAVVYAQISIAFAFAASRTAGPAFSGIGSVLLLVVRASLVPSHVGRTAAVGIAAFGGAWLVARDVYAALDATTSEGLTFMSGAFVVATSVTSHVIYGLRRQVSDAMRLGQYQLDRKLGEGGMGVVYRATHVMLRRPTAVKLLPTDAAAERSVARFEREVQQTSRLEHPNSVRIFDYGRTPEGQFYYAMELLDGVTLRQLVEREGPLPEARVRHLLAQAAHALAEAHALGLVHRDVKPANIMLCDRGRIPDTVKVLDFGLVKVTDEERGDAELTHANAILGTPQYMAPEAIRTPEEVGPPADVYALGAVGFYLVTGQPVFRGDSVVEICAKHLEAPPPRPSAVLGRAVDPDLEDVLLSCLAKDPRTRPADGAALADALEALELRGWTTADARAWWDAFEHTREATRDVDPTEPTQLAVDVGRR